MASEMMDQAREAISNAARSEAADKVRQIGRKAYDKGVDNARDYAEKGMDFFEEATDSVASWTKREPWMAIASAFVVGFVVAQVIKRI